MLLDAQPWHLSKRWVGRRFSLRTLLIALTLVAVVLGTIVWWKRSIEIADRRQKAAAKQAADQRAETDILLREITTRVALARQNWINSPQRARNYLDGRVSGDTTDLSVYQVPLEALIIRLQELHYNFRSVDVARLKTFAESPDADSWPILLHLMDQACRP
jgi:hypothetical protein